jgi:hypothetical protein
MERRWRGHTAPLAADLPGPASVVQLDDVDGLAPGDLVVLRNDLTSSFIERIGMTGKWRPCQSRNRAHAGSWCIRLNLGAAT